MRARTLLAVLLTVALAVTTVWAGQTIGVRTIDVSSLNLSDVNRDWEEMPIVIASAEELYNILGDEEAAAAISGQVDFARESLLYFTWIGSGLDRIKVTTVRTSTGLEATFAFRVGRTLELRPNHCFFAVANDVSWRVGEPVLGNER
jgi:hypothetical protein